MERIMMTILNSAFSSESSRLRNWLTSDDILVADPVFRDSIELIEDLGLITKMPHFLQNISILLKKQKNPD